MTLDAFFKENKAVALGFSGGVDSSYLLYAGLSNGARIKAYFVKSAFQPQFELKDAQRIVEQIGAEFGILEADVLSDAQICSNPANRCYYCKKYVFGAICKQAHRDGLTLVIDGTNASDDIADRPGVAALNEFSVRSPLRECGLTKDKIRQLSKDAGLFTWDKAAYACLATRIPFGRAITQELLHRIEGAETALFEMGFTNFRVRVLDEAAKLQFPKEHIHDVINKRLEIVKAIKPYFTAVLLDMEGR